MVRLQEEREKPFFSQFSPGNYPLSEEVDPIKRTERPNLRLVVLLRFCYSRRRCALMMQGMVHAGKLV
ncbi:hypothetical protein NC653_016553 [Populus alba x Populus x berolinensis]|uniref:Uncharacterized protein n=1 Tax=Populus alba x Populus x berolinensis TaxID=444605 RepID=A0AAD6VZG7_9ROSI|nr:hypothetical protein NC653_016553 [Populus alba x Populus x berolinensis]